MSAVERPDAATVTDWWIGRWAHGRVHFEDDLVTLYNDDCGETLVSLPDGSFDAVITDPPYGERTHTMARSSSQHAPAGGRALSGSAAKFGSLTEEQVGLYLAECGRISRGWVVATIDYHHAFAFESNPPEGLRLLRIGVWLKRNPMPMLSGDRPAQGWEAIAYLHRADRKPSWNGGGSAGNFYTNTEQSIGHPTAKPLGIVSQFVRWFTPPRGTVLDPFAGSGTTLVAAKAEGRRAVGIEIDRTYCDLAVSRLAQGALDFGGTP